MDELLGCWDEGEGEKKRLFIERREYCSVEDTQGDEALYGQRWAALFLN